MAKRPRSKKHIGGLTPDERIITAPPTGGKPPASGLRSGAESLPTPVEEPEPAAPASATVRSIDQLTPIDMMEEMRQARLNREAEEGGERFTRSDGVLRVDHLRVGGGRR